MREDIAHGGKGIVRAGAGEVALQAFYLFFGVCNKFAASESRYKV